VRVCVCMCACMSCLECHNNKVCFSVAVMAAEIRKLQLTKQFLKVLVGPLLTNSTDVILCFGDNITSVFCAFALQLSHGSVSVAVLGRVVYA